MSEDIYKLLEDALKNIEDISDKEWSELCKKYTSDPSQYDGQIPCTDCGKYFIPPNMPYYGDPTICPKCQSKNIGSIFTQPYSNCACINCPNNPTNGGSGICHCTLGGVDITC